jgi:hypothetical protein
LEAVPRRVARDAKSTDRGFAQCLSTIIQPWLAKAVPSVLAASAAIGKANQI